MKFKNNFEMLCYQAVERAIGTADVDLQHNKELTADFVPGKGVISFSGSPKKEIDVLCTRLTPDLSLLISAKDLETRATPAMVQEWASVVQTMNKHAEGKSFLGLVVSACGFTSGCGAWAIDSNLGLVPPYKGKVTAYSRDAVERMLERVVRVSRRLAESGRHNLGKNSNYYWSVYKCTSDFAEASSG